MSPGVSYHHNRRQPSTRHERERDRDRDRDRYDRERDRDRYDRERFDRIDRIDPRDRDRLHARERDLMHYDLNSEELIDERGYGADYTRGAGAREMSGAVSHHHLQSSTSGMHHSRSGGGRVDDIDLMHDRDDRRYPSSSRDRDRDRGDASLPPPSSSRRDRDEYSPHRGGGSSRRVLNAM